MMQTTGLTSGLAVRHPRITLPSNPKKRHSVTVVIPCYNYGHFLDTAIQSAFDQVHVDCRAIIVDDNSTDNSLHIAYGLAKRDRRLTVISHKENLGHIRTYNHGLSEVDTEFVTLVSADDLVAPGALDRAVALMERFPSVGLVYGKTLTLADGVEPMPHAKLGDGVWRIWTGRAWIQNIVSKGYNPILSPEAVLRTTALRQIGGYNPNLPHSGDLEYWLRVATRWNVGQIRGVAQAYYRIHGHNMHLTRFHGEIDNIVQKSAAFDVLASRDITRIAPWARRLHGRGVRTLTKEALSAARSRLDCGEAQYARELAAFALTQSPSKSRRNKAERLISDAASLESIASSEDSK